MSWFKLLNEVEGTVKKVSADGKKMTVQTTPGQKIEIDTDKDPNIDIQQSGNQAVISLGSKNGPNVGKKIRSGQKVDIGESPDYRLQAQRDTMNLSDQAIVELVASLYKKIDQLGHREETDAEYFDDLYKRHPNESEEELNELGYGSSSTAQPSRATINKQNSNVANRRYNITVQDQNRDAKVANKTVAGSNIQATGQGAVRAGSEDPDDIERAHNSNQANANAEQASVNAQEIERLKQLAMGS